VVLASEIKDLNVYSKDMVNLGRVKDLEFDPSEMKVTNIIVEFQKEAAKDLLGKRIVLRRARGRVPVSEMESLKDALNLKLPREELKNKFKGL
jgi:sporulation protein YlmC with PRC-barrel domain